MKTKYEFLSVKFNVYTVKMFIFMIVRGKIFSENVPRLQSALQHKVGIFEPEFAVAEPTISPQIILTPINAAEVI